MSDYRTLLAESLLYFINASPTPYHAVANSTELLEKNNYIELKENEAWKIEKNGKYFVRRNNSAFIAFEVGTDDIREKGFRIVGAHTDSPCFKIKPGNNIVKDGYIQLNTESYGGSILSSWFDRPLSIAGKIVLKGSDAFSREEHLVDFNRPICLIPNLAIHLNRDINDGYKYNKQKDLLPILTIEKNDHDNKEFLLNLLVAEMKVSKADILDYDLFLYGYEKGLLIGPSKEFIFAPRLDDLWMVYAGLQGLFRSKESSTVKVLAAFDNEEVGSLTPEGANSLFLRNVLKRLCMSVGLDDEGFLIAMANSVAISADAAHAVNPNYSDKHDPVNRPTLGKGPVIKYSAPQRYSTNAVSASLFAQICEATDIPYQRFVNRSDMIGGSTIGHLMSSIASVLTVDIGAPLLAMHSIMETGAVDDNFYMIEAFNKFYEI